MASWYGTVEATRRKLVAGTGWKKVLICWSYSAENNFKKLKHANIFNAIHHRITYVEKVIRIYNYAAMTDHVIRCVYVMGVLAMSAYVFNSISQRKYSRLSSHQIYSVAFGENS